MNESLRERDSHATASSRVACASLVTTESYVIGAVVLGESLKRSGWPHDTVMLVTPEISAASRERLALYWKNVVEIDNVKNPVPPERRGQPYFTTVFTKLRIWEQTAYDKLIYLDADTIVVGPIEELLERRGFAAAPCMWLPDHFNSGVMVVEPSRQTFDDMLSKLQRLENYDGSDQGFLNSYFHDWYQRDASARLPVKFNFNQFHWVYGPSWNVVRRDLRVLHYTRNKPWNVRSRIRRVLLNRALRRWAQAPSGPSPFDMWWQIHDSMNGR
jgi:glycogenin glucosyltransferase